MGPEFLDVRVVIVNTKKKTRQVSAPLFGSKRTTPQQPPPPPTPPLLLFKFIHF
jgi:hypothetical protein